MQTAFQISRLDNVATALGVLEAGTVALSGDTQKEFAECAESVPAGHKLALCGIEPGDEIIKYGVAIGVATKRIPAGGWVHLHCVRSLCDERSSHLDAVTGAPGDIIYE